MTREQEYVESLDLPAFTLRSRQPSVLDYAPSSTKAEAPTITAAYWHRDEDYAIPLGRHAEAILAQCREDVGRKIPSVLLVENISPELIGMLGVAFDVDPRCWLSYLAEPPGRDAWEALFRGGGRHNIARIAKLAGWRIDPGTVDTAGSDKQPSSMEFTGQLGTMSAYAHSCVGRVDSRWSRLQYFDPASRYGASWSTRLTYFVLADTICERSLSCQATLMLMAISGLFLVDACGGTFRSRQPWCEPEMPMLRIPCSDSYDGLVVPHNRAFTECSVFTTVAGFLSTTPHRQALMSSAAPRRVIDPITLAYYLCAGLHWSNLRILESQMHDIAFKQLQSDDTRGLEFLNQSLHQRREDIVLLRSQVQHAQKSLHPDVRRHLARLPVDRPGDNPLATFDEVQHDAREAQRFLMETFQLLTSTINIRDARLSIEQAARATRLTQLASVYLPLTLVTGIFGMNVREIAREGPSWWACVVTLAFVVLLTSVLLWGQAAWKRYKTRLWNEVMDWVRVHHCGKRGWKWARQRWYNLWKS